MNIAIIGCSGHYNFCFEAIDLCPSLTLCAVAPGTRKEDMSPVLLCATKRNLSPIYYEDYHELLQKEQIDIAVVNPWFCDTASVSIDCLNSGVHVFAEKPLAVSLDQLDELEKSWRSSGKVLAGMFNLRYCSWFLTIRNAIENDMIGKVRLLHGQKSYKMGTRPELYRHRESFGGLIPWVAIHALDWVLQLGGHCEWVMGTQDNHDNRDHGDMEITAALLLKTDTNVIATVNADYLRPDGAPRHDDDRLRVTGTKGMLEAMNGHVYLEDASGRCELPLKKGCNCLLAMINMLETDESKKLAEDTIEVTRVALMARDAGDQCFVMKR